MQKQKIHIKRRARGEPKGTGKKIEKCYVIKSESHKATWTFISLNFQVKELKLQKVFLLEGGINIVEKSLRMLLIFIAKLFIFYSNNI